MNNGRVPTREEQAMFQHMQQQGAKQKAEDYVGLTLAMLYSNLVRDMILQNDGEIPVQQQLRNAAKMAKDCAPYAGEARGMFKVNDEEPADD